MLPGLYMVTRGLSEAVSQNETEENESASESHANDKKGQSPTEYCKASHCDLEKQKKWKQLLH